MGISRGVGEVNQSKEPFVGVGDQTKNILWGVVSYGYFLYRHMLLSQTLVPKVGISSAIVLSSTDLGQEQTHTQSLFVLFFEARVAWSKRSTQRVFPLPLSSLPVCSVHCKPLLLQKQINSDWV